MEEVVEKAAAPNEWKQSKGKNERVSKAQLIGDINIETTELYG